MGNSEIVIRLNYRVKIVVVLSILFMIYQLYDMIYVQDNNFFIYKIMMLSSIVVFLPWTFNMVINEDGIFIYHKITIGRICLFNWKTSFISWKDIEISFRRPLILDKRLTFLGINYIKGQWPPLYLFFVNGAESFINYIYDYRLNHVALEKDKEYLKKIVMKISRS